MVGRFVQDRRALFRRQLCQNIPSLLLICRQKSLKAEPSGGHPAHGKGCDQRAGSRKGCHADALLDALGSDDLAGVGDGGRAGVGHDGDILAAP